MAESTGIDWADATFNPWMGCANVSPGCGHCYAKTLTAGRMGIDVWADSPRQVTSSSNWRKPLRWAKLAREGKLPDGRENRDGHRPRVFCASLADVFEDLPQLEDPRWQLMQLIYETRELDWLILTKRPEFMAEWMGHWYDRAGEIGPVPEPNIWLGTSIENSRFTWRADILREIPAAVHFISAEPLLGSLYEIATSGRTRQGSRAAAALEGSAPDARRRAPLDPTIDDAGRAGDRPSSGRGSDAPHASAGEGAMYPARAPLDLTHIEWVIVGGESGPGYRPMNVEHAREIRDRVFAECDDCEGYGLVQGHHPGCIGNCAEYGCPIPVNCECRRRPAFFFKQHGGPTSKAGGKLLDGREWCEFPTLALTPA